MQGYLHCKAIVVIWWFVYSSSLAGLCAEGMDVSKRPNMTTPVRKECEAAIGLQRFFLPMIDWGHAVPEDHLPYGIFVDLAFRSHFDPDASAIMGDPHPKFLHIPNLHPCLRIEVKLISDGGSARTAIINQNSYFFPHGNDNLTNTHSAHYGFDGKVHASAGLLADAWSIVHMATNVFLQETKQLYPNFFRAGATLQRMMIPTWAFYKLYAWRDFILLYSTSPIESNSFEHWVALCNANGVRPSFMFSAPLTMIVPFQASAISSQLKELRQLPTRLVIQFIDYGGSHMQASGMAFNHQVYLCQMEVGLWMPTHQIVGDRITYLSELFLQNATLQAMLGTSSYGSFFYVETSLLGSDVLATIMPGVFWFMGQLNRLAAVDLNKYEVQERYGLHKWPSAVLQSILEKINGVGGLLNLLWSSGVGALFTNWAKTDVNVMLAAAHSCFLDRGGKSAVRNTSLFGSCLRQDYAHKMTPVSFDEKNEWPDFWILVGPVYAFDSFMNTSVQVMSNPVVNSCNDDMCLKAGRHRGFIIPVWGNGVQSDDPPVELVNCTPGMMRKDSGVCVWCEAGRHTDTNDAPVCNQCPVGKYAAAKSAACSICSPGKFAAQLGSPSCHKCSSGTYAGTNGSSRCMLCLHGTFSAVSGATACQKCGEGFITEQVASARPADCICPKGSYQSQQICVNCMEGLACEDGWPRNWAVLGSTVQLQPNYYAFETAPNSIYSCLKQNGGCPGGAPGFCDGDRMGFLCSVCAATDHRIVGATCKKCPTYVKLLPAFILLAWFLLTMLTHFLANGGLAVSVNHSQALLVFMELSLATFQIFGVFQGMNMPGLAAVNNFMLQVSRYVTLDESVMSLTCVVGNSPVGRYVGQVSLPFGLCMLTFLVFGRAFEIFNVLGHNVQDFFLAFCVVMVKPLQCYIHPNLIQSVITFPTVLCWDDADHIVLLSVAIIMCVGFIIPFVATCVWACWKAPTKSCKSDERFLRRFRFLLYRFRPDCWWWGIVFLLRQIALAIATLVPYSNSHAQLFYTSAILAVYVAFAVKFWPWITVAISILDSSMCFLFLFMVFGASQFLLEPAEHQGRLLTLMVLLALLASVSVWFLWTVIRSILTNGLYAELNHHKIICSTLCQEWLDFLDEIENQDTVQVLEAISRMNAFDRRKLGALMDGWTADVVSAKGHSQSLMRLQHLQSKCYTVEASQILQQFARKQICSQCFNADKEHITKKPPAFKILASHGAPESASPP